MIVHVTQKHINQGLPGCTCCCPVALAIRDNFPATIDIAVGNPTVEIDAQGDVTYKFLTPRAFNFIIDFDANRPVLPFSFILADRLDPME